MNRVNPKILGIAAALAATVAAHAGTTTFDGTTDGWGVFGSNDSGLGDFLRSDGGNPGGNLEFLMVDTFGVNFRNDSNADVLGDYSRFGSGVTFGIDVKAESIQYLGGEVSRHIVVELVDYDNPPTDLPYTSVWYDLGTIQAGNGWQSLAVTVDPTAIALPTGWGGYGAETALGEPILPPDRTFASVLASVDEVRFTTYVPGWFYGFTDYDLRYDNATVQAVPEPATVGVLGLGLAFLKKRKSKS